MFRALKHLAALLHRYTLGGIARINLRRVGPERPRAQAHQSTTKKRTFTGKRLHLESLEDRRVFAAGFAEFVDPNPSPGNQFGFSVVPLSTGNVVVTSPFDDAGGEDAGAVYLFNGRTGALISTLTGSHAQDRVGGFSVTPLANGNFVVVSSHWHNGDAADAGAVTFGNGITGVSGIVSPNNSLVGISPSDQIGSDDGITALANGNYVIKSPYWDAAGIVDAGAVTFGNGIHGTVGFVSATNSLVGSTQNDRVGLGSTIDYGVLALTNGNYVVISSAWDNGDATDAGAVTFGDGMTGITGAVSASNSLVGSTTGDTLGAGSPTVGVGTVVALSNGNYVVSSPLWDNGSTSDVGAVTLGNGVVGTTGAVSAANSLVGSTKNDHVGASPSLPLGVTVPLKNGNYVVASPQWDNGSEQNVGAVTFCDGINATTGPITVANSLVGSQSNDSAGAGGVTALTNGNYVVATPGWRNGTIATAGAVTFGKGDSGITGPITTTNSLVGGTLFDQIGSFRVRALSNGNYVVQSPNWHNGNIADAGAATFGDGVNGTTGVVGPANSLVGSSADDRVGAIIAPLPNGNYLVPAPGWNNGSILNAGAVTFGNGSTGVSGVVSAANSLVGTTADDKVGIVIALPNGNYVVTSREWDDGSKQNVGAVTFGDGASGIVGAVSSANSLVGSTAEDKIGDVVRALVNGNYVVSSTLWDDESVVDAGAVTFGNGTTGIVGVPSVANSLVGSSPGDIGTYTPSLQNGNYLVFAAGWDNGLLADAGAVTFANGLTGIHGTINAANSMVGEAAESGLTGPIVLDDVNQNFYARFLDEGGGRVRVGSQIDGFSRPWHLAIQPQDVSNDGQVVAGDVLAIINYINAGRPSDIATDAAHGKPYGFLDVTGDGKVVPEDVIAVINYINAAPSAEGEAVTTSATLVSLPASTAPTPNLTDALLLLLASDASSAKKRR